LAQVFGSVNEYYHFFRTPYISYHFLI